MNKYINASLIGVGHLGKTHLRILKEIAGENENINLIGIYDTDPENLSQVSSDEKVRAFHSLDEAIESSDTLIIVTPTSTHYEIAKKALQKNINIFIEKPVTSDAEEAQKLIDLAKDNPAKIQIGHIERFNPAILALDEYSLAPIFIESHRLAQFNPRGTDVSVIHDLMIHDIDIILNLVKSPVTKIDANGVAIITGKIDIANARITFENGCVANVTASRISQSKMRKMRIFQKNAYISIDFLQNLSEVFKLSTDDSKKGGSFGLGGIELENGAKVIYERPVIDDINPLKFELMSFFDSITQDKEPLVTLEDGKQAIEVAGKIIKEVDSSLKQLNNI
ncbi:MAG TPA: Gfo/Idh/MocA family oxidoreductase [Ignavibacteria bacterium]|nr:Gfo/Idh/MocA family oxidoreductase [Ignavibacteria bacterium]